VTLRNVRVIIVA